MIKTFCFHSLGCGIRNGPTISLSMVLSRLNIRSFFIFWILKGLQISWSRIYLGSSGGFDSEHPPQPPPYSSLLCLLAFNHIFFQTDTSCLVACLRSAQDHVKKLCLWDVFGTVSSQEKCRLSLLQNNIVWLGNLTQKHQTNSNIHVVVGEQ